MPATLWLPRIRSQGVGMRVAWGSSLGISLGTEQGSGAEAVSKQALSLGLAGLGRAQAVKFLAALQASLFQPGPASLQAAPMEGPTMCWSLPQWEEAEVISRKHRPNGHVGGTEPVASSSATEESSRCLPAEVTLGSEPRLPWGRANRKAVSETIKYQENALCYN
ncbi:uncharacterized protein LOC117094316 isoform X3 [Trachypithecus francoisi]|uniref:uncharacterized protein LOC117094316 isoform X3 n=1 Tax=Trachypithecus francoisi TaxID=54180 RepID=UPI00141B08B3|nr:uncharacterized protein LOC117094316 isoform X3 [Trachypithecus francoisi]